MRATSVLLLKRLARRLHPPGPVTTKESQQLLRLLDSSFRKRLDERHPAPGAVDGQLTQNEVPIVRPRAADSHLDSVLHHPLLATNELETVLVQKLTAIQTFENAVRDSRVDTTLLYECCKRYLASIKHSRTVSSRARLGVKIDAWMSSAPAQIQKEVLTDIRLLQVLLPVMYANSLEGTVWNWLSNVYGRTWAAADASLASAPLLEVEDMFVSEMMGNSIKSSNYEDAVQQFIKANEYRTLQNLKAASSYPPLKKAWARISSAIVYRRQDHKISESAFDALLACNGPAPLTSIVGKEFLMVYHPSKPNSDALYGKLQDKSYRHSWASMVQRSKLTRQTALLLAILDASELALNQQKSRQSQFFLDLAEEQWPAISAKHGSTSSTAERLVHAREEAAKDFPFNVAFAVG